MQAYQDFAMSSRFSQSTASTAPHRGRGSFHPPLLRFVASDHDGKAPCPASGIADLLVGDDTVRAYVGREECGQGRESTLVLDLEAKGVIDPRADARGLPARDGGLCCLDPGGTDRHAQPSLCFHTFTRNLPRWDETLDRRRSDLYRP